MNCCGRSAPPAPQPNANVPAGLDYLSSPAGPIAESQQLAAQLFGCDATWFLVNGCSAGIHAAVLAVAGPGDTLLVARNCHLSAFSAMALAGVPLTAHAGVARVCDSRGAP